MLATASPTSITSLSDWYTVFETGLSPSSEIGNALVPIVSGVLGAEVKYNFGFDLASRPMLHSPPSDDYKPISAALFLNGHQVTLLGDEQQHIQAKLERYQTFAYSLPVNWCIFQLISRIHHFFCFAVLSGCSFSRWVANSGFTGMRPKNPRFMLLLFREKLSLL